MSNVLGRSVIGAGKFNRKAVPCPEWGGDVLVRELSGEEVVEARKIAVETVDTASRTVSNLDGVSKFACFVVGKGWINEDGSQVLHDGELSLLKRESSVVIERLSEVISAMSGLMPDAVATAQKN